MTVTVSLNGVEKTFSLNEKGVTVHDFLASKGITHNAPCAGQALCKRCKVRAFGNLSTPQKNEIEFLTDEEILYGIRLACHAVIQGDVKIFLEREDFGLTAFDLNAIDTSARKKGFGAAFDIGTTTIACYLYDFEKGECIAKLARENRQRIFGDDIISRITAAKNEGDSKRLKTLVFEQMNDMLMSLGDVKKITYITVSGNTTMLHLLTGLDPSSIATAPFVPVSKFGNIYRGEQLGLCVNCDVFLLPCVSAYIGADITAGFCACDFDKTDKTNLLIDIGTNGEMGLVKNGEIFCCSTAAGPAFEGAHISSGMAGVCGAISHAALGQNEISFDVIGNVEPMGICGSGLIDIVAILLKTGVIDQTGYMDEEYFVTDNISITPKDIREIQLAKSAIVSGIQRLFQLADVEYDEIDTVYLAGGFGTYIDPKSAADIGLIPHELRDRCKAVGNTSAKGAVMALNSDEDRDRIEKIPKICRYHELSGDEKFDTMFIENIMF